MIRKKKYGRKGITVLRWRQPTHIPSPSESLAGGFTGVLSSVKQWGDFALSVLNYFFCFLMTSQEVVLVGFYLIVLLYTVILHEVAHGVVALWLGDKTAQYAGRLTLNPVSHIDIMGSIIVPLLMFFTTGLAFGWAKPVPYNPYNLKNQEWGPVSVAFAGPGSNFLLAFIAAVLAHILPIGLAERQDIFARFFDVIGRVGEWSDRWGGFADAVAGSFPGIFLGFLLMVIFWNVLLGVFNMVPIPPLDGSKLLYPLLSLRTETIIFLEQYGFVFLLLILFSPLGSLIQVPFVFLLNFFLGIAA